MKILIRQRDFGWMADYPPPQRVSDDVVLRCRNEIEALQISWDMRRVKVSQAAASAHLGIPPSHLSNILQGKKYLPNDCRVPFMWLVGNLLMRQFEDRELAKAKMEYELRAA